VTAVHQVLAAAAPGDATTNAALDLRRVLGSKGRSEVFAAHLAPELTGRVHPLSDFGRVAGRADRLVVHVSIGEPRVTSFLAERSEPLSILYHNITPAPAFAPWDPDFARLLDEGRRWLAGLAGRAQVAVAVSEFSASELRSLGFGKVVVAPLPIDPRRLATTVPDLLWSVRLAGLDGPAILHVGQVLPHKRLDWLIMAYHALVTHLMPEVHLVVVGAERQARFAGAVRHLVADLNLPRVHLLGPVAQSVLVAAYRRARVFATASEHEGYCVPLLEAMAFDVPVVARAFGAVPETLGGAGLLLPPGDGPLVAAEALACLLNEAGAREEAVARGRERVEALSPGAARSALAAALLEAA
jgi:glycosyltransferase involved in cell wall biosynthesis